MSILNSNANRQTADVVRSVSKMITNNIQAIYRWLMVDSEDMQIKGDYETISTGYEQYIAKEVHNTQLINFLQTIGSLPQLQQYIKYEAFSRPLLRAFNLDPEQVMKTEEQVAQEMQQQAEAQKQTLAEQAQQAAQLAQQQIQAQAQAQAQSQIQVEQTKAILDEKMKVSDDQREMERAERLELIKDGNVLHPTNLERFSILLREQMDQGEAQQMLQEEQAMKQEDAARLQQQQQAQMQQQQQIAEQEGPPPGGQGGLMAGAPGEGMVEEGAM
jgi:cell envelope opacity-associated protein A